MKIYAGNIKYSIFGYSPGGALHLTSPADHYSYVEGGVKGKTERSKQPRAKNPKKNRKINLGKGLMNI